MPFGDSVHQTLCVGTHRVRTYYYYYPLFQLSKWSTETNIGENTIKLYGLWLNSTTGRYRWSSFHKIKRA